MRSIRSFAAWTRTPLGSVLAALPLACAFMGLTAGVASGQDRSPLKPRVVFSKPEHTVIDAAHRADRVVVKFHEGTRVRERSGQLVALVDALSEAEETRLARATLTKAHVVSEVEMVRRLFDETPNLRWAPLFARPEGELDRERADGERQSGEELADLNLYYAITLDPATVRDTERLIDRLNALDIVETAYPEPVPQPAGILVDRLDARNIAGTAHSEPVPQAAPCTDIPPLTASFRDRQGYLDPAPRGIDADYAWKFEGGRGEGVRIIDVEGGWNLTHENLPAVFFQAGENSMNPVWRQHGTAVFGELVGCGADPENGHEYGVTGIAHQAGVGYSSIFPSGSYAPAINTAAAELNAGEIVLIELQSGGPACDLSCNCQGTRFVPTEYAQAVFDVIQTATARGVLVVQAAGNGSNNLDCPAYDGRFDRSVRDSGAIMVGAGSAGNRVPLGFTNYGSRVDLQGWGQSVMTTGYGEIRINGADQDQWYSASFGGTSSASPVVVGAVALVQSVVLAQGLEPLQPADMLQLLQSTGTPQAEDPRNIGPLPDLRNALSRMMAWSGSRE